MFFQFSEEEQRQVEAFRAAVASGEIETQMWTFEELEERRMRSRFMPGVEWTEAEAEALAASWV